MVVSILSQETYKACMKQIIIIILNYSHKTYLTILYRDKFLINPFSKHEKLYIENAKTSQSYSLSQYSYF